MTVKLRIPLVKGRPLILFPRGWKYGWLDPKKPDPNVDFIARWTMKDWQEFRELHYLGIMPSPFGYHPDPAHQGLVVPHAPWGMSEEHQEPRLHPADE